MKPQVTRQSAAPLTPMASTGAQNSSTARTYSEREDRKERIALKDLSRVGANSDCTIVLDDATVFGSHAVFRNIEGCRWIVQDLGSTNGTWVNGKQIDRPAAVNVGDRIAFGRTRFVLRNEGGRSQSVLDKIVSLRPYEFEKLTEQLFGKLGFDATVTKQTGDGGVDVEAIHKGVIFRGRYLLQCKRYRSHKVTRPEVQAFHGRLAREPRARGIFITTSSFTRGAQKEAELTGINLINGQELESLVVRHSLLAPSPGAPKA
jgi:pSer/pThr/pTyr-binding forkhead associated (FHA) protein